MLACRSVAASTESAALGDLTIHIGETAEAALRIATDDGDEWMIVHEALDGRL